MRYEIVTHDGQSYQIAQDDPERIGKLAGKLELIPVRMASGGVQYFSKGTVARLQQVKSPATTYKTPDELGLTTDRRGLTS